MRKTIEKLARSMECYCLWLGWADLKAVFYHPRHGEITSKIGIFPADISHEPYTMDNSRITLERFQLLKSYPYQAFHIEIYYDAIVMFDAGKMLGCNLPKKTGTKIDK